MKDEIKQIGEALATHPKTSVTIAAGTPLYAFINSLNPILDFVATILGIFLAIVLIRYHLHNTNKVKKENEDKED